MCDLEKDRIKPEFVEIPAFESNSIDDSLLKHGTITL